MTPERLVGRYMKFKIFLIVLFIVIGYGAGYVGDIVYNLNIFI